MRLKEIFYKSLYEAARKTGIPEGEAMGKLKRELLKKSISAVLLMGLGAAISLLL